MVGGPEPCVVINDFTAIPPRDYYWRVTEADIKKWMEDLKETGIESRYVVEGDTFEG